MFRFRSIISLILVSASLSWAEGHKTFLKLDIDENGAVSFEEFVQGKRVQRLSEEKQKRLFERLDKDGSGQIEATEMKRQQTGRSQSHGIRGFKNLDTDGNGSLSFEEFSASKRFEETSEELKEKAFKRLDRDDNGEIDRNEARPRGGQGKRKRPRLRELDKDGDGSVSFEEFQRGDVAQRMQPEAQRRLFDRMDRNGDGVLSPLDRGKRRSKDQSE